MVERERQRVVVSTQISANCMAFCDDAKFKLLVEVKGRIRKWMLLL